jgi:hypothetical protein
MRLVITLLLFSGALSLGCSSSAAEDPGSDSSATPADYSVSCQGDVTPRELALDLDVEMRCTGGQPGTRCGGDPCAAMDVQLRYEPPALRCGTANVFVWDGKQCSAHPTQTSEGAMRCRGADCPRIFKTEADCKSAYAKCAK